MKLYDKKKDDLTGAGAVVLVVSILGLLAAIICGIEYTTSPEKFSWPDCVDHADWVTEDRTLNGNAFHKIESYGPTLGGNYLVKECIIDYSPDKLNRITCGELESKNLYNYRKIECPKTY